MTKIYQIIQDINIPKNKLMELNTETGSNDHIRKMEHKNVVQNMRSGMGHL